MSNLAFRLLAAQQALASNTNLYMWGNNTYGQLGVGSVTTYYSWAQIHAGGSHTVALRNDGVLFGWGNNAFGQLGDGTTINKNSPVQIGYFSWNQITAGLAHTAGIRSDGTLWAWGGNQYYQLNDNTTIDKSYPVQISNQSWTRVAAGALHTVAINADGSLWTWGSNDSGQLGNPNSYVQLEAGPSHIAGIRKDGTLWIWGGNANGQLGDNTTINKTLPTQIPGSWISVTAGLSSTYAIRSDGTAWGWGYNTWGNLGQGDTNSRSYPVQIKTENNYIKFATKPSSVSVQTYLLNNLGQVFAMGGNAGGELGVLDLVPRSSPVQVSTTVSFTNIFSGNNFAFALATTGALYGWGRNNLGQLGDNTIANKSSPVQLSITDVATVVCGVGATLALKTNKTLWGWGDNSDGAIGDSTTINKSSPVQISGSWDLISASAHPSAAITYVLASDINNNLYGWGNNAGGQLGINDVASRSSPTQIGNYGTLNTLSIGNGNGLASGVSGLVIWGATIGTGLAQAVSSPVQILSYNPTYQQLTKLGTSSYSYINAGKFHTAAITTDNRLFTWGNNYAGQLGDGTFITRSTPVQIAESWTSVYGGGNHTLAIRSDSTLYSWGKNTYGQLGLDDASTLMWSSIHDGGNHLVAIRNDGGLFTWGQNSAGQLGDGTTLNRNSPVQIGSDSWSSISAGLSHTAAIRNDGKLFVWGSNVYGQLGQGFAGMAATWSQVAISVNFTIALRSDGTIFSWGLGTGAQLGQGVSATISYPTQLGNDKWLQIATGATHALAIKQDGSLWAWGTNSGGQLGNFVVTANNSPVLVAPITSGVSKVFAGFSSSAAIGNNGYLYTWGLNTNGQLGDGTTASRSSPVQLGNTTWSNVSLNIFTLATKPDGTLWGWGRNDFGQLGTNDTVSRSSPVQIASGSWAVISASNSTAAAIKADGSLWTWGLNLNGQLGQGDTINRSSPVQVGLSSWTNVNVLGGTTIIATSVNGTVWGWGFNTSGQLGLRDVAARSSPVQIAASGPVQVPSYDVTAGYLLDGKLYLWGGNASFAQGDGTVAAKSSPTQLGAYANASSPVQVGSESWSQVAAGGFHTLAMKTDNALYGWGLNNSGQVGGATSVLNPLTWSMMSGNILQTLAIRNDGKLYAWGTNTNGQLGDLSAVTKSSPVLVVSDSSFVAVASGDAHSLAITTDGKLFGWGKNDYGQAGALSWTQISVGVGAHTVAIRSDGALFSWGNNNFGQLGDNTTVNKSSPVALLSQTGNSVASWISVATGNTNTLALRSDYTLWGWGRNDSGELGLINTVNRSSPVQIGNPAPSMFFNGSTEYITIGPNTGFAFPTSTDFTIEMWIQPQARAATAAQIYDTRPSGTGSTATYQLLNMAPDGSVSYSSGTLSTFGGFLPLNAWSHIAVVRQGTNTKLYVNGTQVGTTITNDTTAYIVGAVRPIIGTDGNVPNSAGFNFTGFINNLRVVKGVAVYTGNFTVPTSNLTATQSSGTNISAITAGQTTFLLSNTFSDISGNNLVVNTATIGSAAVQSPFEVTRFATSIVQIAAGAGGIASGYALTNDNKLWVWGGNSFGVLGDGTTNAKSSPVQLPGSWSNIIAGIGSNAGGFKTDGTLWIWGANDVGQLGDSTAIHRSSPVQLAGDWSELSLGAGNVLGIKQDGTLWTWGFNNTGQLGQGFGNTISRSSPVQIGTASNWASVYAGTSTGHAIDSDGLLYGWGSNLTGSIGTSFIGFTTVNGGSSYIRNNGLLYVWGRNDNGQLGLGDTINRSSPVQLGTDSWLMVKSSTADTNVGFRVGIKTDYTLWTWGYNVNGQLGDGTNISRSSPVQITGTWINVETGYTHTIAQRDDGTLWAWGFNGQATLGDGTTIDKNSPVQVLTSISNWSQISSHTYHNLALTDDGKIYGWGQNTAGQLLPTPLTFTEIGFASALRADGQLWVWGVNGSGQLGDNTTVGRSSPVQIAGQWKSAAIVNEITAYPASHGIRFDGTLWGWGKNDFGGIGVDNTINRSSPIQVGSDNNWIKVFGTSATKFALKSDYTLYGWGSNGSGELGDGTTTHRSSPVQIAGSWTKISSDYNVSLGIKIDGTLWAWGFNSTGALGQADTISRSSPVQIPGSWTTVSTLYRLVTAIRNDGRLFTWGTNTNGSIGDSSTVDKSSPIQIGTSSWSQVTASLGSASAITLDGKLFTWGANPGVAATLRSSPVQLGTSSWTMLSTGYFAMYGVTLDNRLFAWANVNGPSQGDNTIVAKSSPVLTVSTNLNLSSVLVPSFSSPVLINSNSWSQISAGGSFSMAIQTSDRSLWTWGTGADGVLGHGLTTSRSSPVQVGVLSWSMVDGGIQIAGGITVTGGLYTWGYGLQGGLGSGATASRSAPVQVATSSWSMVSFGGFNNVIGLDINNRLFTWGTGTYGDVGDNTVVTKSSPVAMSTLETPVWTPTLINTSSWTTVATVSGRTEAITSDYRLFGWGLNTTGEIGDVSTVSRSSPVQVAAGTQSPARSSPVQIASGSWTSVAAGNSFSAAIRDDGAMFAWGINSSGQIGNGVTLNRSYPTQIGNTSWTTVNAGADFIVAKDTTGKLYAWGNGWSGALGSGNQAYRSSPVQIGNDSWSILATGSSHVVAIRNNTLYAWGRNIEGQVTTVNDVGWSSVQCTQDGSTMIGIDMLGRLFAWGNLGVGAFGVGYQDNGTVARSRPVQIAVGQSFIALGSNQFGSNGTGNAAMFAIDNNNKLWAWGDNTSGAFGNNSTISRSSPVQIATGQTWKKIVQGYNGGVLGLTTGGALYGWGLNSSGQLGLGDASNRSSPVQIQGSWLDVDIALYTSHAIRADGTLWGWGGNTAGSVGDNSVIQRNSPVQIMSDRTFKSLGTGYDAAFAISTDNDLYAWGSNNNSGQLGDGTTLNRSSPVQVGAGLKWNSVKGGVVRTTAAITVNNFVYGWGSNSAGELGTNDTIARSAPVQIQSLPSIKSIFSIVNSVTQNAFYYVDFNNRIFTAGANNSGLLGDGTTVNRSQPVQLTTGVVMSPTQVGTSNYTSISAGTTHTAVVTSNGKLFVWGGNGSYQLGDGTTFNRSSPVQIGVGTSFVFASAMGNDTFAGTNFGTFNVGENTAGQLGIGTILTTSALSQVSESMSILYPQPLRIGTSSWSSISSGVSHSSAIRTDNTLWLWGNGSFGEIGDNTTVAKSSPVQVAGSWLSVSAGNNASAAIRTNSTLYVWGNNLQGQLGDNTTVNRSSPVQVQGYWSDVQISGSFTAALNVNGTIWTWGTNRSGVLGLNSYVPNTFTARSSPTQVSTGIFNSISASENSLGGIDTFGNLYTLGDNQFGQLGITNEYSWYLLTVGRGHALALRSDKTLWAWGNNTNGQLGDSSTTNKSSPIQIGSSNWINVCAGGSHTVAIKEDYTAWTWGKNNVGQIGDGTTFERSAPVQIAGTWSNITAGQSHTLAIKSDGSLYGWGLNQQVQLGDGTTINKSSPVQIPTTTSWTAVSAGQAHTLGLDITNKLYAWGNNASGQLGITDAVSVGTDTMSVAVNAYITTDGRLFTWGNNAYGQLMLGDTISRSSPVQVGTSTNWYKIFPKNNINSVLAVQKTDGTLWVAGYNVTGALGLGDTINRSSPVQLSAGAGLSWIAFSSSQTNNSVGIKSNGTLWTMGSGISGEIGDGTTIAKSSPVQVAGSWIDCVAGTGWVHGIRSDYTLWAWGNNNLGSLGVGNNVYRSSPLQVYTASYRQVVAGTSHGAAITFDYQLVAWGYNIYGALGDNTTVSKVFPVGTVTGGSWLQVAAGGYTTYGIKTDGTLWAWGDGLSGQLGDNFAVSRSSPIQVTGGVAPSSWTQIIASVATVGGKRLNSNDLFVWGNAPIGDGSSVNRASPVAVIVDGSYYNQVVSPVLIGTSSWSQINAGPTHSTAIDASGRLFTWGLNSSGQLGYASGFSLTLGQTVTGFLRNDGSLFGAGFNTYGNFGDSTTINRSSPVQIGGTTLYSSATMNFNNSYAIRKDGKLFAWGRNYVGQLGDGTTITRSSPIQIGSSSWIMVAASEDQVTSTYAVALGIKSDNTLWAWGRNIFNQFGSVDYPSGVTLSSPVQIGTSSWSQVYAGYDFALGLKADNTLWAWGSNIYGQLGLTLLDPTNSWTRISSTYRHSLGLRSDGTVWSWGSNTSGQIGDNSTVSRSVPVQVLSGSWTNVSAGQDFSVAIKNDNTLWGWGINTNGQLGDFTTVSRSSPIQLSTTYNNYSTYIGGTNNYITNNGTALTSLGFGTAAFTIEFWVNLSTIVSSGFISCEFSTVSRASIYYDATTSSLAYFSNLPNSVVTTGVVNLQANTWYHIAYSRSPGSGRLFLNGVQVNTTLTDNYDLGSNNSVYIGYIPSGTFNWMTGYLSNVRIVKGVSVYTGNFTVPTGKLTVTQSAGTNISAITAGQTVLLTCQDPTFIDASNTMTLRVVGSAIVDPVSVPFTQSVLSAKSFTQVAAGRLQTIGLVSDSTIWAWGGNDSNSLGDSTTISRSSPVQVGTGFTQYNYSGGFNGSSQYLTTASSTTLALDTSDFTVDGWFYLTASKTHQVLDYSSAGGFGFRIEATAITAFISQSTSASVAYTMPLNQWTHLAIVRNIGLVTVYVNGEPVGTITAFGATNFTSPSDLNIGRNASGTDYVQGYISSIRITKSALYLGSFHPEPVLLATVDTVLVTCQLSTLVDSSVYARTITNNSVSVENISPAPYANSWTQVDTGNQAMTAITSDGRLYGWGNNSNYQLMNKVNVVWKTVDQGAGIRADGRLFMWGHNFSGALGDGTVISKSSPIQIGTGSNWKMITTGKGQKNTSTAGYTLAIKNDGTLWAWGSNNTGQLGLNDTIARSSPVQIPGSWMSVDASSSIWEHVLAIRSDGLLFAWGYNVPGLLGDGTTINRSSPVQIGASSWIVVSAGYQVSAAVRSDNTLWAWGSNGNGNIGDNTTVSKSSPVQVAGTWRTVSIGNLAGYGIKSDYTLWGWGYNVGGNVGDNTITMRSSPVQVGIGSSWLMVSGSGEAGSGAGGFALAIRTDYTLWGWGTAALGQLGQNDVVNRSSPVQISGNVIDPTGLIGGNAVERSFVYVKAGGTASFATDTNRQLWSWGDNGANVTYGQEGILGNGTTVSKSSPVQVGSWNEQVVRSPVQVGINMLFNKISTGADSVLAIKTDGTLFGWGADNNFQTGLPYSYIAIGAGGPLAGNTSAQLRADGVLYMFGQNVNGSIGDNTTVNKSSPVQISAGANRRWKYVAVTPGTGAVAAIKDDNTLWAWGFNNLGQLGQNNTIARSSPVQISGTWVELISSFNSFLARRLDGTLWAWGGNENGQVADNTIVAKSSPVQIAGSWTNIWGSVGTTSGYVFARNTAGTLFGWGYNVNGQLGDSTTVSRSSPVQISGGFPNMVRMALGSPSAFYLNSLGQLFGWGLNTNGTIGDNTTVSRSSPVQIHAGTSYVTIGATSTAAGGIRVDGTVWTWGTNTSGQLGQNIASTVSRSSPVQVNVGVSYNSIFGTGIGTMYATQTFGPTNLARLWGWGAGAIGSLGDGTTVDKSSPIVVTSSSTAMVYALSSPTTVAAGSWTQIVASKAINTAFAGTYGAAIRTDGTLWVWGANTAGGLGFNNTATYAIPTQFGPSTNWSRIDSNDGVLFTLNSLGQLYGGGYNAQGQIGDNTTINRSSPVQINLLTQVNPIQIPGSWSQIGVNGYGQNVIATKSDGSLFTWGRNDYGQLGQNDTISRSSPVQILAGTSFVSVATGTIPTLGQGLAGAVATDGSLYTWGYNFQGQLGDGTVVLRSRPVQVINSLMWSKVYISGYNTFAVTDIGKLYAWGNGDYGSIGLNDTVYRSSPIQINTVQGLQPISSPTQVGTNTNWSSVTTGDLVTSAKNTLGKLFAWGDNSSGFVGEGNTISRSSPVQVSGLSYSLIAAGGTQLLATVIDPYFGNRMVTSGLNTSGQQGVLNVVSNSFQVAVSTTVATNASSPVQVGSSYANYRSSPVQVGASSWTVASAGENHSLGINSSGLLFGWGYNANGQVGDSTTINKSSPVQISALTTWVDAEAGYNHSTVEKSDGSVYAFGNNNDGQLGDGT